MMLYIDAAVLEDIEADVRRLMNFYVHNPSGADYSCQFCGQEEHANQMKVDHREDCNGVRYLKAISAAKCGPAK